MVFKVLAYALLVGACILYVSLRVRDIIKEKKAKKDEENKNEKYDDE